MTIEELEIIVSAKIEPALKEIKKLMPAIKQQVTQAAETAQKSMEKIDVGQVTNKVQKAVQAIKNKMNNLKKSNKDNEIAITINNKEAKKQITQLEKEIDSLHKKINSRKLRLETITPRLDAITQQTAREVTPEGLNSNNPAVQKVLDSALSRNKEYTTLLAQENKMSQEIKAYNEELNTAKLKMSQLKQEINQTSASQNKLTVFFSTFKEKIEQSKNSIGGCKKVLNSLPKITQQITNNITGMGTRIRQGLGTVLKYAGALFSLRTIYNALSSSASAWLSSQNAEAKQLSANIDYLRYAMGSVLAPIIEYITNLVYKLMKAIQSLVYAFSGVNIFAKATAESMKKTSGSATKASKSLAGVHNEINNVSENKGAGSGIATPSMDLSEMETTTNNWIDKFKNKLMNLFEPIKKSWNKYGSPFMVSAKNAFKGLKTFIGDIGKSLEEVWMNGTGEQTISLFLQGWTAVLETIGNIGDAFSEAWNSGNAGTNMIQNLWTSFNDLYSIVTDIYITFEEWTASESFQNFASAIIKMCGTISGWFGIITQKLKEIWENGGRETFTKLLEFVGRLGEAIAVVFTILSPVVEFALNILTPVIEGIIKIIGDVIDALSGVLDFLIGVFTGDWERAWGGIEKYYRAIWNAIKDVVQTAINFVKTHISSALNLIKKTWTTVWNAIKTVAIVTWKGIWTGIKGVINIILGGIEKFANNTIRSVNFVLSGISKIASAVGSLVGLNPINLQIPYISLPRLAKGNVAYSQTLAIFGEYSGASNNPEITTPQNVMAETFRDVLSDYEFNNNSSNGEIKQVVFQFGSYRVAMEMESLLRQARRQNGVATINV